MNKIKMVGLLLLVMLFAVGSVSAAALDNTHMGSKANAMGKAFTGLADDASAVFYNPAGLVFQDKGIAVQTYGLFGLTDLSYEVPLASAVNESDETFIFPGFFMNINKGDLAFGFGVYIPYGGGTYKYDDFMGTPGSTIEQSLGVVAFSGSVAKKFSDKFSVGASVTGYYGMFSLDQTGSPSHDMSGFAGIGGNLGIMYKPTDKLTVGFTAKLPVSISIEGETTLPSTVVVDGTADIELPWYFTVGVAFKASEALTLTMDFNYATYSSLASYTITVAGTPFDTQTYYENAMYIAVGADYKFSEKLSFRGGVTYTPNATEDEGLSLSADVSHLIFGLGLEFEVMKWVSISLSGHYLMGFDRTVDDSSLATTTEQTFGKSVAMFMAGLNFKF